MLSVCVDTSVLATVAVVQDGNVVAQVTDPNPRRQAEGLSDLFAQCMADAEFGGPVRDAGIDRVLVGTGPGPYTGLRAGLAFASALGAGLGVPVMGVSSQEILGFGAADFLGGEGAALGVATAERAAERAGDGDGDVVRTAAERATIALVLTDARRKEVYYSAWKVEGGAAPTLLSGPAVADISVALSEAASASAAFSGLPAGAANPGGIGDATISTDSDPSGNPSVEVFFAGPVPRHLAEPLVQVEARLVDLNVSLLDRIADAQIAADPDATFSLEPQYLRRPDVNTK